MQHLEVHIYDLSNKTKIKLIEMITKKKKKKKEARKQGSRHILLLYRSALAYYDAS